MEIITLKQAYENLTKYIGIELSDIARDLNITIIKEDGGYNKGWKGHVLERIAGHTNNNLKAPNGLGYEIKSTAFSSKDGVLIPRETMCISMINPKELEAETFYESHFWSKLKILLFCAVSWDGNFATTSKLLKVNTFQTFNDDTIIQQLKSDYEQIQLEYRETKAKNLALHTINGVLVQQRTKGSKNSRTRAFYAKKDFVKQIFELRYTND